MPDNTLVSRIINLRESKDWSQAELARRLDIEKSVMNKIENGTRKVHTNELMKIGELFSVSVDFLLYGEKSHNQDIPKWASPEDVIEIENILNDQAKMTLGGEDLDEEEAEDIRRVLRASLWRKLERKKARDNLD